MTNRTCQVADNRPNKATPEELVKRLRKYAAECGNCDGTGKFVSYPDEWPCELCATERETADLIESQRNAVIEECLRALAPLDKLAHTYASENADLYRGFDNGVDACLRAIRVLKTKDDSRRAC